MRFYISLLLALVSYSTICQQIQVAVQNHHYGGVDRSFFSADDAFIYTLGGGVIKVWEVKTGLLVKSIPIPVEEDPNGMTVSSDNKYALVNGHLKQLLFDLKTGELIKTLDGYREACAILPNGTSFIDVYYDRCIDITTGKTIWTAPQEIKADYVRISRDGKRFMTHTVGSTLIRIFSTADGSLISKFNIPGFGKDRNSIENFEFNRNADKAMFAYKPARIVVFDVDKGNKLFDKKIETQQAVHHGVFDYQENLLVGLGKEAWRIDWKNDQILTKLTGHNGWDVQIASAATMPVVLTLSRFMDESEMFLWDIQSGTKIKNLGTKTSTLQDVEFSLDGKSIAGTLDWSASFVIDLTSNWTLREGVKDSLYAHPGLDFLRTKLPGLRMELAAQSSKWLAAKVDNVVKIYDRNTMTFQRDIPVQASVKTIGFNLQEHLVIHGGKSFDPSTGQLLETKYPYGTSHTFTPDHKYLFNAYDNFIEFRSAQEPFDIIKRFEGDARNVSGLSFYGNRLLSFGSEGIKIWDFPSLNLLGTILTFERGRRVISTPAGYYMADNNIASNEVVFIANSAPYLLEQFDIKYNRPDLVLQQLNGRDTELTIAYRKAYQKRLKKMGITEAMLDPGFNLPEVVVTERPSATVNQRISSFTLKGSDKLYNLQRINVYVNNVPVYGSKGLAIEPSKTIEKTISLPLTNGLNVIQVSVTNERGAESLKETFNVTYNGPVLKPALYVIAIGVSEFQNSDFNLTYAAKDASDIASLFKTNTAKYSRVEALTFLNAQATKKQILEAKELLMESHEDDEVMVFVASHGLLDNDLNYYIATHDVDFNNPASSGLLYEELESLLDGIPARKKCMLLDACHSGEVDKEDNMLTENTTTLASNVKSRGFKTVTSKETTIGLKNSFDLMNELFADFRKGTGTIVISSASGTEFAFESSQWKNGVFTYSVLEGLSTKSADSDSDGTVKISELKTFVFKRVSELTDGKQHPTSRTGNQDTDFNIW